MLPRPRGRAGQREVLAWLSHCFFSERGKGPRQAAVPTPAHPAQGGSRVRVLEGQVALLAEFLKGGGATRG